jgi:chorismate-pyruvate lyase
MSLCYDDFWVRLPPPRTLPYGNAGMRIRWIGTFVTLNLCASAISADSALRRTGAPWPDTFLARVEVLALIETLNARVLGASCTVTEILDKWCADHKMASEPVVHARRITGREKPVSPEQRQRLQVGPEEEVTYRHVELTCGGHILVEADNWYVPSRVGTEINRVLTTTDTPFGRAVQDLKPIRENLSVEMLWKPLLDGWELGPLPADRPGEALAMPWQLFQHRAVIYNYKHEPFSEVREIFTRDVLAFGPP